MIVRLTAIIIPLGFYLVAQTGTPPTMMPEDQALAARFQFEIHEIGALGETSARVRQVNPALRNIASWISSVGAGVALADIDGDGLWNDYCLIDPRGDSVTIGPLPTTGDRFPARLLHWTSGGRDPSSVAPMGCLAGDYDEDGLTDLLVYFWGRPPAFYLAASNFQETPVPGASGTWYTNAGLQADIDGDGHLDLLFGNYFPDDAGVLGLSGQPAMQHSMSRAANAGSNRLLLKRGHRADGTPVYVDASAALEAAAPVGWTLAIGAADLDGDQLPEIYIANDFGPDRLLHNRSRPGAPAFHLVEGYRRFTDPRSRVLGRDSFKGMGVDFADFDADGDLDIHVSNIAEDYALMESHFVFKNLGQPRMLQEGSAPFVDVGGSIGLARSAWGWDARFADFDGNGIPELLQATGFVRGNVDRWPELQELAMANDELIASSAVWPHFAGDADLSGDRPDAFFVRRPSGKYVDLATLIGLGEASVSRGIAIADIDGDGDLDAVVARQWEPSVLLKNRGGDGQRSIVLDLRVPLPGPGQSRPAYGATATLIPLGHRQRPTATVSGGNGHSGKSSPEIHFGLSGLPEDTQLLLQVSWRDSGGQNTRTVPIEAGRHRIVLNETFLSSKRTISMSEARAQ